MATDILRGPSVCSERGFGVVQLVRVAYPPSEHASIVLLGLRDQQPQATLDVLRCFLLSQDLTQLDHSLCVITEDRVRIRHG